MFVFPISTTSAVSANVYAYSNSIELGQKWFDQKQLTLSCLIEDSNTSGILHIIPEISNFNGEFTSFVTGSGSSKILDAGTVTGGIGANGYYVIPLTIVPCSGVTELLKGIPRIRFGTMTNKENMDVSMHLLVG